VEGYTSLFQPVAEREQELASANPPQPSDCAGCVLGGSHLVKKSHFAQQKWLADDWFSCPKLHWANSAFANDASGHADACLSPAPVPAAWGGPGTVALVWAFSCCLENKLGW